MGPGQGHYIVLLGKALYFNNVSMMQVYANGYMYICTSGIIFFSFSGNLFSSLEGLEVVWELKTVEGVGSVSAQSVLR